MKALATTIAILLSLTGIGRAQNCCAPAVPQQGVLGETTALPHTLDFGLHYEYLCSCGKFDGSTSIDDPDDTRTEWKRATLTLGYGVLPKLSLSVIVPYVWKKKSEIVDAAGTRLVSRAEGAGDVSLLLRYSPLRRSFVHFRELSLGIGVKAPTGATDRQMFGMDMLAELQPGTGSWDYIGSMSFYQGFEATDFVISATYLLTTGYDGYDFAVYEFGNQFSYLLTTNVHVHSRVDLSCALTGTMRAKDRQDGDLVSSTGRHQVWIMPGVQVQLVPAKLRLHAFYEAPVYQHFNGEQLGSDHNVRFTMSFMLPLAKEEEE